MQHLFRLLAVGLFTIIMMKVSAQTSVHSGSGTDPDGSAMLDVQSASSGLLIPRVALTGTSDGVTIATPATSLLVYNTATSGGLTPGYHYNSGTPGSPNWTRLMSGNTTPLSGAGVANQVTYWSGPSTLTSTGNFTYGPTGNLSVLNAEGSGGEVRLGAAWARPGVYSSNGLHLFSGSTQPLYFGNDNIEYMRLTGGGNLAIGNTAGTQKLDVTGNIKGHHLVQGPLIARPMVTWSVGGNSTGAVIIKLPGNTANYGMLHMQIDVYEYGSTGATSYILGGHNWNGQWYNFSCQTIGTATKKVRLAVKDGQYAVVLGETGSTWSYGHVVLSKITNGGYYTGIIDLAGNYSIAQDNSAESYTWITGDLNNNVLSVSNATTLFPNITGDNLGNHTATTNLLMSGHAVTGFGRLEPAGVGGNSGQANHSYAIFQESGAWAHPYPDLRIAFHTGIKLGANSGYNGIRFYNDSDMATQTMSVGDGDNHVRVSNHLFAQYLNSTDNAVGTGVTGVMVKAGDNYFRTGNAAAVASFLGTSLSGNYIQNQTSQQAGANFNISGTGQIGAHGLMTSVPTTYGSLGLGLAKNGYYGLLMGQATSHANLMFDGGGNGGIYYENWGWSQYYLTGPRRLQINTASDLGHSLGVSGSLRATGGTFLDYVNNGTLAVGGGSIGNTDAVVYVEDQSNNDWGVIINKGAFDYGQDIRLSNAASYGLRILGSGVERFRVRGDGVSFQPFMYDIDDTGYYLDPNGTSQLNQLTLATRARWGQSRIWTNRTAYNGDPNYWTGANGWGTSEGTWANAWKFGSGGVDIWGSGTDHPQGAGYIHAQGILSGQHYASADGGQAYGWMMVGATNATENRYWLRGKWGGSTSGWVEMLTTGNIGSYGDNLGNHTATTTLNMNSQAITSASEIYVNGWFRNNTSGHGLFNQATTMHLYSNNGYWKMAGGGYGYGGTVYYNGYESDLRGYTYWDGSGFGLLHSSGGWAIRTQPGYQELYDDTYMNRARPYIMYDRDDGNYYVDPNGYSVINTFRVAGGSPAVGKVLTSSDGAGNVTWEYPSNPWENMGTNVHLICAGGAAATDYEWGVTYNNSSPILRVTCNSWNSGQRICTYPPYPTGDVEPFTWGGACWLYGTSSAWDDACSGYGTAYHSYYYQDGNGRYNMAGGNGCGSLPTVYRRRL